jgi:hypothetical protein
MSDGVEVSGMFLLSFARACINLQVVAGEELESLSSVAPGEWVTVDRFVGVLRQIESRYPEFEPIKERIGAEMMKLWYEHGPGRQIVTRGVDFLHHQTGSNGYHSVVRGPAALTGSFVLEAIDEERGVARVRSTTPFDRTMERGVLLGGLALPGDLSFIDVTNAEDRSLYEIEFH